MSQTETAATPNVAVSGGAMRYRSAVRRLRAASYMRLGRELTLFRSTAATSVEQLTRYLTATCEIAHERRPPPTDPTVRKAKRVVLPAADCDRGSSAGLCLTK